MTIEFSGETTCGELVQEQPDNMTPRPNLLAADIATAVMVIILLLAFWPWFDDDSESSESDAEEKEGGAE
jgi:hypothetical protein